MVGSAHDKHQLHERKKRKSQTTSSAGRERHQRACDTPASGFSLDGQRGGCTWSRPFPSVGARPGPPENAAVPNATNHSSRLWHRKRGASRPRSRPRKICANVDESPVGHEEPCPPPVTRLLRTISTGKSCGAAGDRRSAGSWAAQGRPFPFKPHG